MVTREILDIIRCPSCRADAIGIGGRRHPELQCGDCGAVYPVVDGIADLTPRHEGKPVRHYRTESLYNAIAPVFDYAFPVMSLLVWHCPPLRYVDWAHRAVGRATGGKLLVHPVGTGFVLGHVQSPHTQFPVVAVDVSWRMLRRAKERFERAGHENITLIRAEPEHLPLAEDSFRCVMSFNGLNGFYDRGRALSEMVRVGEPHCWMAGSALCRGLERSADRVLSRYERWGVYPILRSREFLIKELSQAFGVERIQFETHGAVVYYLAEVDAASQ